MIKIMSLINHAIVIIIISELYRNHVIDLVAFVGAHENLETEYFLFILIGKPSIFAPVILKFDGF
jgi:hypothetical protein